MNVYHGGGDGPPSFGSLGLQVGGDGPPSFGSLGLQVGGDGPPSFGSLGLQVGGDWSVTTNVYDHRSPILSITVGRLHLGLSPARDAVTGEHLEFAHALAAAAGEYLIECDRIALESIDRNTGDDTDSGGETLAA